MNETLWRCRIPIACCAVGVLLICIGILLIGATVVGALPRGGLRWSAMTGRAGGVFILSGVSGFVLQAVMSALRRSEKRP